MAGLPSTGEISMLALQTEFGGTPPIGMDEYYSGGQNVSSSVSVPSSGMIGLSNFRGKAKPTGFLPSSITGLNLWLDATDSSTITQSTSRVSQWNDKSGNSRHFTQATSSEQPSYETTGFGGKACINVSDGTRLVRAANSMGTLASSLTMSVFVVAETTFTNQWNITLTNWTTTAGSDFGDGTSRFHLSLRDTVTNLHTLYTAGTLRSSAGGTADNTKYVSGFVWSGANQTSLLTLNGTTQTFTPTAALPNSSANATSVFGIGDSRAGFACKRIAEVIMYDTALTTTDRQSVENYLKAKYAI